MMLMCILNLGIDRYKVMTNGRGASGEDRISKLPRGLIARILHHLNIHEIARTSVLSKTLSKSWPKHPYLCLDKRFYLEITCNKKESTHISEFHKVFNMILSAHTGPIIKFDLYVSPMLSRCFNHKWIEKLYEKGLRDLLLVFEKMENNEMYVVPSTLFGCQDLIQFRLLNSVIGGPSGMPGRSSFPNLTSVLLFGTTITLDMTFGPQLQNLHLESCSGIEHLAPQFTSGNNLQNLYFYNCTKIEWQWFQCTTKLVILGLTLTAANSNMKEKVNKLIKLLSEIPTFSSLALNGPALEVLRIFSKLNNSIFSFIYQYRRRNFKLCMCLHFNVSCFLLGFRTSSLRFDEDYKKSESFEVDAAYIIQFVPDVKCWLLDQKFSQLEISGDSTGENLM